ncbi:hypothetical protein SALBM311S_09294 [Streptomyces alboniger]
MSTLGTKSTSAMTMPRTVISTGAGSQTGPDRDAQQGPEQQHEQQAQLIHGHRSGGLLGR